MPLINYNQIPNQEDVFINNFQQIEPSNRYANLLQQENILARQDKNNIDYSSPNIFDNLQANSFQNNYQPSFENRIVNNSTPEPTTNLNSGSDVNIDYSSDTGSSNGENYGIADYIDPIDDFRITSPVGRRKSFRTLNGKSSSSNHHGTDFAPNKRGTMPDIRNVSGGVVLYAGKAGGYGNTVLVRNPQGYLIQYGHLNSINVKVGDTIPRGHKIGVMGKTGNSTGVHLDMVVVKDGMTLARNGKPVYQAPRYLMQRAGL